MHLADHLPVTVEELQAKYAEAVKRENFVWNAAFTQVTESVGPFELVPMTLRHMIDLRLAQSPFVCGGTPTPADANIFLWRLSAGYSATDNRARARFDKLCRFFFEPELPWLHLPVLMRRFEANYESAYLAFLKIAGGIYEFFMETIQDWPPHRDESNAESYFSDAAAMCHSFGNAYGWTVDTTMNCPLKILFQMHKLVMAEARKLDKKNAVPFKPSDRVRQQMLELLNQNGAN